MATPPRDLGLLCDVWTSARLSGCQALAACIPEQRRGPVHHALATLVRQRVFQIACGYADQDDGDTLRTAPLLKLVCGRLPDSGADLASQPTLTRLENALTRPAREALALALVDLYLRQRGLAGPPKRIVLDLDGTDDPAHGQQEGVAYHGYYRQQMDYPLLVYDGDTGQLITAILRPGNVHASRFVVTNRREAPWPSTTSMSTAGRPRTSSRTSRTPCRPTASVTIASGPTPSTCSCMPRPIRSFTRCAPGWPASSLSASRPDSSREAQRLLS